MTTTRTKRCVHCNIMYSYHPSTYGFVAKYNDKRYCPECFKVIISALKAVPMKFKKKFISTTDYTREEIIGVQDIKISWNLSLTKRVLMPLYDLKDSSNHYNSIGEIIKDPVSGEMIYYIASWWSKEPDKVKVIKEVWWDLINNKPA